MECDSGVSGNLAAQLTQLQHCRRCRGQSRIVEDSVMPATGDVSSETNPDICQVRSVAERRELSDANMHGATCEMESLFGRGL